MKKWPKVSILWLNYNSSKLFNIVKMSLRSIFRLDYPNYEVILIDGGSDDDSFDKILNFLSKINIKSFIDVKIVKLKKNIGAPGSYNIGYKFINKRSKYLVHMDNDVVVSTKSLKKLIYILENYNEIAAIQGLILHPSTQYMGTSINDELLNGWPDFINIFLQREKMVKNNRLLITQWVHGTFSIYRISALKSCIGNKPFIDEFFLYSDDVYPGFKLTECGYKVAIYPEVMAIHYGGAFKLRKYSEKHAYFFYRSFVALVGLIKLRYKPIIYLRLLKNILLKERKRRYSIRGFLDGLTLRKLIVKKYGKKITIIGYKIPFIIIPVHIAFISLISGRKLRDYVLSSLNDLFDLGYFLKKLC